MGMEQMYKRKLPFLMKNLISITLIGLFIITGCIFFGVVVGVTLLYFAFIKQ